MGDLVQVQEFKEVNYALMWDEQHQCDVFSPTHWRCVCETSDITELRSWLKLYCPTITSVSLPKNYEGNSHCMIIDFMSAKEAAAFKLAFYGS